MNLKFVLIMVLTLVFVLVSASFADSSGIWLRAEDVLGGEDSVFGSDFDDSRFSFYSGNLTIGAPYESSGVLNYAGGWSSGSFGSNFVISDGSDRLSFSDSDAVFSSNVGIETFEGNSVLSIKSSEYAAVDFGDLSNDLWGLGMNPAGDLYISETGIDNRFYVEQGGNVGIGTSSPSERLHVEGDLRVTGNIFSPTIDALYDRISDLESEVSNNEQRISDLEDRLSDLEEYLFSWETGGWSSCSATCGTGTQTRSVWCETLEGDVVDDSYCVSSSKPSETRSCTGNDCEVTYTNVRASDVGLDTISDDIYGYQDEAELYCNDRGHSNLVSFTTRNVGTGCMWYASSESWVSNCSYLAQDPRRLDTVTCE